jgi:hypothetical protein
VDRFGCCRVSIRFVLSYFQLVNVCIMDGQIGYCHPYRETKKKE